MFVDCIFAYAIILYIVFNDVVSEKRPHLIVIVADDLGWNDVGFHGSIQIPTPNIDALAYAGVILNNYYVQPICTPSRSALLSGMHPIHTGLQHRTISGAQPYGLPLSYTLLPQHLNKLGYVSRHVGKWHLGYFEKKYTPTYRGFHSHYGYWGGRVDYYSRTSYETPGWWGFDFRRNMEVDRSDYGLYTTDLFTKESVQIIKDHNTTKPLFLYLAHLAVHSANGYDPLQAPEEVVKMFKYIKDQNRRKFAGMLWKLDESVGLVVKALEDRGMLSDSVIMFTTDNGGPAAGFNDNAASNWPFRGVKAGMWEGGIRGASFIWSPKLENPGRVHSGMIQVVDWLPTLYAAAGGNVAELPAMDGMDVWASIRDNAASPRTQMLHNIDPTYDGAAVRVGDWKLIFNPSGYGPQWDKWFGPSGRSKNSSYYVPKRIQLMKNSIAAYAITKLMSNVVYNNVMKVAEEAEVLCGPVPKDATKSCSSHDNPCLFHIPSDPCEYHDVSAQHQEKVKILQDMITWYNATAVPPANKHWDPDANPVYWDYAWTNWKDYA